MQLSKKLKTLSEFVTQCLKFTFNLKYFRKKDDPRSLWISKITGCERRG